LFSLSSIALTLFFLVLFSGVFFTLFDLLGTVVIFADVLFYALLTDSDQIGLRILLILFFTALFTETLDFYLALKGVRAPKTTKKKVVLSLGGALAGAFIGAHGWGAPGLWIGFFLGGFIALTAPEIVRSRKTKTFYRASTESLWPWAVRKFAKGLAALFMVALSLSHIYS